MKALAATILVAALGFPWASAGAPEKKQPKDEKKQEKQEVITNETLKQKYGRPEPVNPKPEGKKAEPAPKPARPTTASPEPDPALRIAELKKEEDRIQRRIQSLKNPFLPKVPPTEEENKAEAGKEAGERIRMLEERLRKIRTELGELEKPPARTS